jgi:hypothetical protein
MGLFSSTTKIYVASTAYNMAGEEYSRINYLKTTVAQGVLTNVPSIAASIVNAQLNGPIMSQRTFLRWSDNNYPGGQLTGSTSSRQLITESNDDAIKSFLATPEEGVIEIALAFIDNADISFFAEKYFLQNNYSLYETNWKSDYMDQSGELKIIYEDGSEDSISVPEFNQQSDYLYVYYNGIAQIEWEEFVTQDKIYEQNSPPDTSGWVEENYLTWDTLITLNTTVTTVDRTTDPDTESSSSSDRQETAQSFDGVYSHITDNGYTDDSQIEKFKEGQEIHVWKRYRINTVETVDNSDPDQTVTTQREEIQNYWDSQLKTRDGRQYAGRKDDMFIYEMGSGNASLDALQEVRVTIPEFYPFIPLRYNNLYINESPYGVDFPKYQEAYEKSTGGDIRDILTSIDDNPSVGDIDHAFLTFGVELNTEEREGRRYTYEFMKTLRVSQNDGYSGIPNWEENNEYFVYYADYTDWSKDQLDSGSPRYGQPAPTAVPFPSPRISKLDLKNTNDAATVKFNTSIEWVFITESSGVGQGKAGAVLNDFWWENFDTIQISTESLEAYKTKAAEKGLKISAEGVTHSRLYWQVSDSNYSYLDLFGMVHVNMIYKGKSVRISTKEALDDEDVTGFVVPMHYPTVKNIPLTWSNELAKSNKIIILNSYEVVKTRWYEKGIFKVIIAVILAVIVALIFPPAAGLLGPNAFVGASMGYAAGSTAAIVAGAAANAIAAIFLTQAISTVSVELFGEKWGKLIASIVTVMVAGMASNYHQTGNFAMDWGKFMRVDNLIGMTDSVATGVQGYAADEVSSIQEDMEDAKEEYEDDVQSIIKRMEELGSSGVDLDPLMFVQQDNSDNRNVTSEPSENFLRRTLLTGSDIAEMTHAMIDDFVEISLTLPEANG